jgi:dienelactone hydrolase
MDAAGVDLRFRAYEGAKHAFSNPAATKTGEKYNLPVAYDEKADKASWSELLALLKEVFPPETK